MLTPFRLADLGHVQLDWLDSRHHFSFGDYHHPARMGFRGLRVINDDTIKAGRGFGFHPHRDMEIITYVRTGTIIHRDSLGNEGRTGAGDVQVMSAGRGITPAWDQKAFPKEPVTRNLNLLVSGRTEDSKTGALTINADAAIYGGRIAAGTRIDHSLRAPAYVILSDGEATINGIPMKKGDGAEVKDETHLTIDAGTDTEILVIEL